MINVVGVRFQNTGKSYYFDPLEFELKRGMHVIVETQRGKEFGTVTIPPILVQDEKVVQPLRPILRLATEEDEARNAENRESSKEAGKICVEKIAKYGLEMKLVDTEYTFDRSKLLFYFTADGRVDFRELVKELASIFRTRIELRQIGVRDETKIKGGLGMCGRELCCTTFLSDFAPVSIRMAKEQNLSLNPSKISGACGRLMCCLKNEQETYEYLNKQLPKNGQHVRTIDGFEGTVHSLNILKQTVKVMLDQNGDKEIREYAGGELAYGDRDFTCEPRESREDELDYFSEQLRRAVADRQNSDEDEKDIKEGKSRSRNRSGSRSRSGRGSRQGDHRQDAGERRNDDQKQGSRKQRGERQKDGQKQSDGHSRRQDGGGRRKDSNERRQDGGERRQDGGERRQDNGERRQDSGERRQSNEKRRQNNDRRRSNGRRNDENRKNPEQRPRGEKSAAGQQNSEHRNNERRNDEKQEGAKSSGRQNNRRQSGGKSADPSAKNNVKQNAADSEGQNRSRDPQEKNGRNRSRNRNRNYNKNREGKQQQGDSAGTKQSDS